MPAPELFIETAARPMAEHNPELQLAAMHELQLRLDSSDPVPIDRATAKLEACDGRSDRKPTLAILLVLMALVSLPIVISSAIQYYTLQKTLRSVSFFSPLPDPKPFKHLTPEQQFLLYGDLSRPSRSEQMKALWESRPDHAPYFVEYASSFFGENSRLPPDFLKTAETIDPDNGWYWAIAAGHVAKDNATKARTKRADRDARKANLWTIKDPAKHAEAIALLHTAVSKPRFTTYRNELLQQRIPLLPERTDYPSMFPTMLYLGSQTSPSLTLHHLSKTIDAEAERCRKEDDREGYRQLRDAHGKLAEGMINSSDLLIDALIAKVCAKTPLRNLRDTAEHFSLPGEAEAYAELDRELSPTLAERRAQSDEPTPDAELIRKKASAITGMSLPMLNRQLSVPIPVTEAELKPGRRAEHALIGRIACLAIWAFLGLSLGAVALFRNRHGAVLKFLSQRSLNLLSRCDWAWVLIGGLVAPIAYHFLITHLTPFTAHDWNPGFVAFLQPAGQFGCTLALLIITPIVIARWRLAGITRFLSARTPRPWLGCLAISTAALALPGFGMLFLFDDSLPNSFETSWGLLAFSVLWLLVVATRALFGKPERALQRQTLARILVPTYTVGMILTIACVPLFHAAERHWLAQDRLLEITAEAPSFNAFEYRVTRQLKSELNETFSRLPR